MRILQINTVDNRGGAAKVAFQLHKELEKMGHQMSMFVGRKYSQDKNIFILNDVLSFSGKVRRKLAYWLANDIDMFSSDHILNTEQFKEADIIHCHNLHSNYFNLGTLEKISKLKPVVWTFHDMWPITPHCAHAFDGKVDEKGFFTCPSLDIFPPIAWHNEKYLEKRKDEIYRKSFFNIVTPSGWLADKVKQSVLKNRPLSVIYNGVDTSIFKPREQQECRRALGLPLNKRIVLIVAKGGPSNPWKGGNYAKEIVKAFENDSGIFFVDLGGNPNQDGLRTKSVGYVADQETLSKYYSAADVLLYPSVADNFPLVVLEATACGLPVVSFKTGGIPEIVEHKTNGYVAEYKNPRDLKAGLEYLLNLPPQEIEGMRQRSVQKTLAMFTSKKMTEQYTALYETILSRR